jgi:Protein of unknown function (DUF1326)
MTDMEHSKTAMAWESMVRPARKWMNAANASGNGEVAMQNWRVSGSYFEVCNCDAPCPCRRLGNKPAGRSIHDTCDFALSWMIKDGHFGATALNGLRVAIAGRWDNAEPPKSGFPAIRPPWHVILYVDDRANPDDARRWKTFSWVTSVEPRPTTMRATSLRCTRSNRHALNSTIHRDVNAFGLGNSSTRPQPDRS